jgi:V/A-type H+-transporting ATPase subunit A
MMELVMLFHQHAEESLKSGMSIMDLAELEVREEIARAKYITETELDKFEDIKKNIVAQTSL